MFLALKEGDEDDTDRNNKGKDRVIKNDLGQEIGSRMTKDRPNLIHYLPGFQVGRSGQKGKIYRRER